MIILHLASPSAVYICRCYKIEIDCNKVRTNCLTRYVSLSCITVHYLYYLQPHRDTEKVDGMFGTLVIQLPSDYKGGQLVVFHQGEKKTFDYSDKPRECYYTAFYADCQHEICEVTEGYRLCLIYNLVSRAQAVPLPVPAEDNSEAVGQVVETITEWTAADEKGPSVMAYVLDHKYCDASLSFSALKNKDRAVADLLQNARKQVNFDLYLTKVTKEERWYCDPNEATHPCRYCDGSCGDYILADEFSLSSLKVNSSMLTPSGEREEVVEDFTDQLKGLMPTGDAMADKEEFAEATGNQGATLDKTYFRTALFVRPHSLAALGLNGMIKRLEEYIPKDSTKWKQWEELAESLVAEIGKEGLSREATGSMLRCLCASRNAELANKFLLNVAASRSSSYILNDCSDEVLRACNVLGWLELKSGLCKFFESGYIRQCSKLLLKLIGEQQAEFAPGQQEVCYQLANIVTNNILQQKDIKLRDSYDHTISKETVCLIFKILTILHCDTQLESLLELFFCQKNSFPLVSVLIPAALESQQQGMEKDGALLSRCIKALDDQLSTSVPCEPTDWSHDITLKCTCKDCKKLQEFLVHPTETQLVVEDTFKTSYHLKEQLRIACPQFNDFNICQMQVLTKNRSSFEAKQQQYQDNLKTLADLRQLLASDDSGEEPPSAKQKKLDL